MFRRELKQLVTSTSPLARAAAMAGADEGLVIQALQQTAGYGRRGRGWQSPLGNFYASLLLRPSRPRQQWGGLSLAMAVAVAEAVASYAEAGVNQAQANAKVKVKVKVKVKWPNDILVATGGGGLGKIAGILVEAVDDAAIVGIGVNLAVAPEVAGPGRLPSVCLKSICDATTPTLDEFWRVLAQGLETRYTHWQARGLAGEVGEAWLARASFLGHEVMIGLGDGKTATGIFHGIDGVGNMLLMATAAVGESVSDSDSMHVITAGDCFGLAMQPQKEASHVTSH